MPGLLKLSWLTQYVSDWAGSEGAVRNLVYRGISRLALLVDGGDTGS